MMIAWPGHVLNRTTRQGTMGLWGSLGQTVVSFADLDVTLIRLETSVGLRADVIAGGYWPTLIRVEGV